MLFVINNEEDETLDVIFCSDKLHSLLKEKGYDDPSFLNVYNEDGPMGVNQLLVNLGVSLPNIRENIDFNPNIPRFYFDQFINTLKHKHESIASLLQNGDSSEPEL